MTDSMPKQLGCVGREYVVSLCGRSSVHRIFVTMALIAKYVELIFATEHCSGNLDENRVAFVYYGNSETDVPVRRA